MVRKNSYASAELPRVLPADVSAVAERVEGLERAAAAQRLVRPPVHELQQLHRELDVAQAARPQLDLPLHGGRARRGEQALLRVVHHAPAHRAHVLDEVLALHRRPDQRADGGRVRRAERQVAGHRPGLEQRLELPGLGPPVVVRGVAGEGAHQRPRLALRAQGRVHLPDAALGGHLAAQPHQGGRQPGGGAQRLVLVGLRAVRPAARRGDEHDVHVADVVQFPGPALAHADHREPARRGPLRQLRPGHRERRLQRRPGQVGQLPPHLGHRRVPGHVPRGDPQQAAPVGHPQRVGRHAAGQPGPRLVVGRIRPDRLQQRAAQESGLGGELVGVELVQRVPGFRVPGQEIAERGADPEHAEQPSAQRQRGGEGRPEHLRARFGGQQPGQGSERRVGIRATAEALQEHRIARQIVELRPGEQPGCGGRIGESAPNKSAELRFAFTGSGHHSTLTKARPLGQAENRRDHQP